MKIWISLSRENPEEVLVTGGWTDDKVSELEKQLGIAIREEVKILYAEIWSFDGIWCGDCSVLVAMDILGLLKLTLRFRKNGLEKKYIVIEGDGELAYCLNNETGEIVNWGLDNLEVYPEAGILACFVLAQLEEAR